MNGFICIYCGVPIPVPPLLITCQGICDACAKKVVTIKAQWLAELREQLANKDHEITALLVINEQLTREREDAPVVVCRKDDGFWSCDEHSGFARVTHTAKLVDIQAIKK